jgi:hypothetical protein
VREWVMSWYLWGTGCILLPFLISALDGSEWSDSLPGRLTLHLVPRSGRRSYTCTPQYVCENLHFLPYLSFLTLHFVAGSPLRSFLPVINPCIALWMALSRTLVFSAPARGAQKQTACMCDSGACSHVDCALVAVWPSHKQSSRLYCSV